LDVARSLDAEREYAYDRKSEFGRLDKAPDAAAVNKWTRAHEARLEAHLPVRAVTDDWFPVNSGRLR
jgi:hypothetical protein